MKNRLFVLVLVSALFVPAFGGIENDPLFAGLGFPNNDASCADLLEHQHVSDTVYLLFVRAISFSPSPIDAVFQAMGQAFETFDYPAMDFGYFEQLFRRRNLPIHLVAIDPPPGQQCAFPRDRSPRKYWLNAHIHRPEAAHADKTAQGVSDEENVQRLNQAGYLIAP